MLNEQTEPNLDRAPPVFAPRFWIAVIVMGISIGLAGGLLMKLLHGVEHLCWPGPSGDLLKGASRASAIHRMSILFAAGIVSGVGSMLQRRAFGKGEEVNAAIWSGSGRVPLLSTLLKGVQSIITVGMGISLGREAAVKDAGGALASAFARWFGLPADQWHLVVAWGVGAGMAAAYNVPLGGALFATEVLLGTIALRWIIPALLCSVTATACSWALLSTAPIYHIEAFTMSVSLTLWAIFAGPLIGLAAVAVVRSFAWAEKQKPSGWRVVAAPIAVFTALGVVAIAYPQLLGNGMDTAQLAFSGKLTFGLLLVLPGLKLLATAGCLASGAKGGLFTPTMTVGALVGALLAYFWNLAVPGASMGCCAVIGSCALLAAATQAPVSAVVLVIELTRHIDPTMVPLLFAVAGATLIARRIEAESIYSIRAAAPRSNAEVTVGR